MGDGFCGIKSKLVLSKLSSGAPLPAAEVPAPRGGGASVLPAAEAVGPWQRGSGGRQLRSTIPFPSMSRFSLLQIDLEVEEPETLEIPTQSFKIHNNVRSCTQLLAVIIYII